MSTTERSRRRVLGAGLGAAAALLAGTGRTPGARASHDDTVTPHHVVLGSSANSSTTPTKITNTTAGGKAFEAFSDSGFAIEAKTNGSRAVRGESGVGGIGVDGMGGYVGVFGYSESGTGVLASGVNGYALEANGRVRFDTSGVAVIPAGATSVAVSPGRDVTSTSFVLLTPMANLAGRDLWFTKNTAADTITLRMSSSRGSKTKVAWLLLG